MQILVLFGLPGAGKTFTGKILQKQFGFYFYDADRDLPGEMNHAIQNQLKITDRMRDKFFKKIIQNTKKLHLKYDKIAVAQTFLKEKHRLLFLKELSEAKFILVKSKSNIREKRLIERKEYPLNLKYAEKMALNFDIPQINYEIINNDTDGDLNLIQQFKTLLFKYPK